MAILNKGGVDLPNDPRNQAQLPFMRGGNQKPTEVDLEAARKALETGNRAERRAAAKLLKKHGALPAEPVNVVKREPVRAPLSEPSQAESPPRPAPVNASPAKAAARPPAPAKAAKAPPKKAAPTKRAPKKTTAKKTTAKKTTAKKPTAKKAAAKRTAAKKTAAAKRPATKPAKKAARKTGPKK